MAWAEKLPSGKYRGVYRDSRGKRRSAGTYKHKAEAARKAATAEEKARRLSWRDPDAAKRKWGDWCDEWWDTRGVEDGTLKSEKSRRDLHLLPYWKDVPVGAIGRQEVKAWRAKLVKGGMSNSTANRCVALLSGSLSAAVDAGAIDFNPLIRMEKLDEPPPRNRFLDKGEYQKLLDFMPTALDRLILMTLASTGLRWGELSGLHRAFVNFETNQITVSTTFSDKTGVMMPYPKGKHERPVPVPPWLMQILEELPHVGHECGYKHKAGTCPGPLLITTPGGAVLRNSKWSPVFRDALDRSGIAKVKIHDMRAAAASWWLDGGSTLAEVREMLGHVDQKTTDRYAQINGVNVKRAVAAIPKPKKKASQNKSPTFAPRGPKN